MNMRKMFCFALVFLLGMAASVNAQVAIGNAGEPHKAAILDLKSTTKGLLLPNVALDMDDLTKFVLNGEAEKATAEGMVVYNTSDERMYYWDGTTWNALMPKEGIQETGITHYTVDGEISNS